MYVVNNYADNTINNNINYTVNINMNNSKVVTTA